MEKFKIYIDRLKNGHVEKFDETIAPTFLDIEEEELTFHEDVKVDGEVYLAEDHLVIHFSVETAANLPCSICNDPVHIPIIIQNAYSTIPLTDINSAIYDLSEEIRETTLLQVPLFAECNKGNCPERERIKSFLNPSSQTESNPEQSSVVHFPFADLDKE